MQWNVVFLVYGGFFSGRHRKGIKYISVEHNATYFSNIILGIMLMFWGWRSKARCSNFRAKCKLISPSLAQRRNVDCCTSYQHLGSFFWTPKVHGHLVEHPVSERSEHWSLTKLYFPKSRSHFKLVVIYNLILPKTACNIPKAVQFCRRTQ